MGVLKFIILIIALLSSAAWAGNTRIISLAPSITQSLYELGIDSAVVGITVHCPTGIAPKTIIGTLWEPNIEKIVLLKPDLVIASKEGNKKAVFDKMKKLGLTVMVVEAARNFDEICANALELGKILGRQNEAATVVASARRRIEAVRLRRKASLGRETVFWEVGDRPLFTIGSRSFMNDYNVFLNTVNLFGNIVIGYPQISREEVLRRNPAVMFIIAMAGVTAREKLEWNAYPTIAAVKNNRVFFIESQDYFVPTPLNFAAGTEYFEQLLNTPPR